MTTNAGPEYGAAEKKYLAAQTIQEKMLFLEEMIKFAPKHKSSENMLAELRRRLAKFKKELKKESLKKKGGHSFAIKKEGDAQITLIGLPNSGKSTLLAALTNAKPKVSEYPFTTIKPEIGTLDLGGLKSQFIELPPITESESDREWLSIARISDLVIVLINSFSELTRVSNYLRNESVLNKKIFVLGKTDSLEHEELSKFKNLSNVIKISVEKSEGTEELKKAIFDNLGLIRVHTKEPGKKPTELPVVLKVNANIREMAGKIRKDYPARFLFAKVWGKSAKFSGQTVGMEHILKDKDIVELHLK